ncbi:AfsR/SARP family transcriptional regulator [Streptomyces hilarionis]|uniref:AfsR/SARP family transcriptional regulator n=1 Tax=Streptomyces hilarionis TaxID=2839954 RepID=UPI00211A1E80|nr:BTAD domain-containing putative transcriptional regulator [Streptomyces hilarionis]MCQ9129270.1 tetratricopeptide repeat protein [Streptomyces hilarionis]
MTVEFGVLGSIEADIDGRSATLGHARQRGVLAVLLVDVNRPVTADQLMGRVWGDRPPRGAVTTLRGYLSRLRRALAATSDVLIARQPGGYVLNTADTVTVDMHAFRRLLAQARAAGDDTRAAALWEQALRLWRGEPFATLDTPWLNALRDTLLEERLAAHMDLTDVRLRLGQHAALLPELSARAAAYPLDERLAGQLMLALHRGGRSAEALDHYHRVRGRLARDLGIDPGPALRAIQTAILRQDTAPHLLREESVSSRTHPAQLPLAVAAFTGRDSELAQLDGLLPAPTGNGPVPPPAVVISALSGTAGVGKTALALHWAHRRRDVFPDGQLYVNLRGFDPGGSLVGPAEAIRGFLDAFGVPPARIPNSLEAQAGLYRSLLADRRVLVVLDNARDADQVRPLLPGAPGCLVLVTSRNRLTSLAVAEGAHLLTIDLLAPAQARDLLTERLGSQRTTAEPAAVEEIVTRCAGLPLALAIVAARASAQLRLPLTALADELRQADSRLDALDGGDPVTRIRAVFSTSYQTLGSDAARLFRLLALHPGPDIALPAAASLIGLPRARTDVLLTELTRGSLLMEHVPGRYAFHDLLRTYATELVTTHDGDDTRGSAVHRMLDHYLQTARAADALLTCTRDPIAPARAQPGVTLQELTDHQQALTWFTAERHVLLTTVNQTLAGFDTHTWQLAAALTTFLDRQGHWPALAASLTTALDAARRQDDKTGQATSHHGLGFIHDRTGHQDDAHTHYMRALALFSELDDHAGRARIHHELGRNSLNQGHCREALGHARQALTHFRAARNRGGQAIALNHIGRYHARLGDRRQALARSREALALAEEIDDADAQAYAWDALGYVHHHLGQYRQAVDCYLQALDLFHKTGDRYHEASSFADLGDTHHAAAHSTAAREAWTRALTIFDELGHPKAAPLRTKLLHHLDRFPTGAPTAPPSPPAQPARADWLV